MNEEKLKEIIENMDDENIVALHNEYIRNVNNYDDEIFFMYDFDEIMDGYKPLEISEKIFYGKGFNPNNRYFMFDGYANLISIDSYDILDYIYIDEIIEYIIDNNDALYNDEIYEVLEEYNEGDEENE